MNIKKLRVKAADLDLYFELGAERRVGTFEVVKITKIIFYKRTDNFNFNEFNIFYDNDNIVTKINVDNLSFYEYERE